MTYNGWTNHETWCVNLWLSNDEWAYDECRSLIARSTTDYDARQVLREYTEQLVLGDNPGASLATDLLISSLESVDWQEIVDALREEE